MNVLQCKCGYTYNTTIYTIQNTILGTESIQGDHYVMQGFFQQATQPSLDPACMDCTCDKEAIDINRSSNEGVNNPPHPIAIKVQHRITGQLTPLEVAMKV